MESKVSSEDLKGGLHNLNWKICFLEHLRCMPRIFFLSLVRDCSNKVQMHPFHVNGSSDYRGNALYVVAGGEHSFIVYQQCVGRYSSVLNILTDW